MVTVTEKLWSDAPTFTFANAAGSGAGSWTSNANNGWSGGTANKATTIGDKVTITWSGRALYLLAARLGSGANFTVTTDGVTHSSPQTCFASGANSLFRYPMLLESGLTDGPHTTVLQSVTSGSFTEFYVNSVIVISGARAVPSAGVYTALGDSWAVGTGSPLSLAGYAYQVQRRLATALRRDITLSNRGASGAAFVTRTAQTTTTAAQQLAAAAVDSPEFLSLMFGVNDLATSSNNNVQQPGTYADTMRTTLQLVEDIFDTDAVTVAVATPGYVGPAFRYSQKQTTGTTQALFSGGLDVYETGVALARQVISEFSWARMADVYAAMDRRTALVYPNSNSDLGLHPNEAGHSVAADEILHSLLAA